MLHKFISNDFEARGRSRKIAKLANEYLALYKEFSNLTLTDYYETSVFPDTLEKLEQIIAEAEAAGKPSEEMYKMMQRFRPSLPTVTNIKDSLVHYLAERHHSLSASAQLATEREALPTYAVCSAITELRKIISLINSLGIQESILLEIIRSTYKNEVIKPLFYWENYLKNVLKYNL